jgi:hypothetical protein
MCNLYSITTNQEAIDDRKSAIGHGRSIERSPNVSASLAPSTTSGGRRLSWA